MKASDGAEVNILLDGAGEGAGEGAGDGEGRCVGSLVGIEGELLGISVTREDLSSLAIALNGKANRHRRA